jgi:hypothetical protein
MTRRQQYAAALKCDRCGTTGSASFEKNDGDDSNQGDLGQELLRIEGKFRAEAGRSPIMSDAVKRSADNVR